MPEGRRFTAVSYTHLKERFIDKVRFYQQVLDRIGIPLIDSYFLQVASDYYDAVNRHEWIQEKENKEEIE